MLIRSTKLIANGSGKRWGGPFKSMELFATFRSEIWNSQMVKERPQTQTRLQIFFSNRLRQREATRLIWQSTSQTDTELFKEFKERQFSKCDCKHEQPQAHLTQVALA